MINEIWKAIDSYEGLYEVSNTGLVRSLKFGKMKILQPRNNGYGYLHVVLCKDRKAKNMCVHRLVANAFILNPNNLETVNHKDENKLNNNVSNLEWLNRGDNIRYSNNKPVLQLDKVGNVVKQFSSISEASKQTGINMSNICQACRSRLKTAGGYVWLYVSNTKKQKLERSL